MPGLQRQLWRAAAVAILAAGCSAANQLPTPPAPPSPLSVGPSTTPPTPAATTDTGRIVPVDVPSVAPTQDTPTPATPTPGIPSPVATSTPLGPSPSSSIPPTPSPTPSPMPIPSGVPGQASVLYVTPDATSTRRPWLAWRPRGKGHLRPVTMPAPWTGGTAASVTIWVYEPAGYATGSRRYPTLYLTPNAVGSWAQMGLWSRLDSMIASGALPPTLVVDAAPLGAPFLDGECIDSADGREHWDTFVSQTLVAWADSHERTIATADARTVAGASQGAYCAADLLMRHPDVFHQSLSFVGYYLAAILDPGGVGHHVYAHGQPPFGGDLALARACSPILIAPTLAPDVKSTLFPVLMARSSGDFYAEQMQGYHAELTRDGIANEVIDAPFGHSYDSYRADMALALTAQAAREVVRGVFGPVP